MSVFGGDSWAREAQHRKRRLDDLILEEVDESSYKKLSSGKYACLVCPHSPILDSPLMLSVRTHPFFQFSSITTDFTGLEEFPSNPLGSYLNKSLGEVIGTYYY
jgi:hypothetical protein